MLDQTAEGLLDQVELVEVRVAGQQRLSGEELAEDAADGPDVDGRAVLRVADEELGRPVPASGHVLGEVLVLDEDAREAEVAQLDYVLLGDQNVLWLDVSVDALWTEWAKEKFG